MTDSRPRLLLAEDDPQLGPLMARVLEDVYAVTLIVDGGAALDAALDGYFDVLIVDEAHHVAPSSPSAIAGGRGYAVDTQRTVAVVDLPRRVLIGMDSALPPRCAVTVTTPPTATRR